jgi:hypothetical protein
MSKLFNLLNCTPARKVWTDEAFEALYNNPKCYDFFKELGKDKDTWAAWSSFLERKKLDDDYKTSKTCWFRWLYWHLRNGGNLKGLYLSAAVQKQAADFLAFYEIQRAKEEQEKAIRAAREREEWRKKKKKLKAGQDAGRIAYQWTLIPEDLALWEARKKEWKDVKRMIQETPFDTTKAEIEQLFVWEREGTPEHKLLDVVVECTNYGLTFTPEDIQAINEGRKTIEECQPIIKEYPMPVITVNEEAKRKFIDYYNRDLKSQVTVPPVFYERSDKELVDRLEATRKKAGDLLRRPGQGHLSISRLASGGTKDMARCFLRRPEPEPPPPPTDPQRTDEGRPKPN